MTDIQRLEQTILDLITTIDLLKSDIKELKVSNTELTSTMSKLSNKIDEL